MSLAPSKRKVLKVPISQLSVLSPLTLALWWPRWSKYRLTSSRRRRAGPRCSCGGDGSVAFPFSSSVDFHDWSRVFCNVAAAIGQRRAAAHRQLCRGRLPSLSLPSSPCPALLHVLKVCGRCRFGAGCKGWIWWGRQGWGLGHLHPPGREAGCRTAPSGGGLRWGRRWGHHLWGCGGLLSLGKRKKLKDAPSALYPSDKYSALSPLDARKKIRLKSWNAFICEILTLCNIYSKADTHLKVIFNIALL